MSKNIYPFIQRSKKPALVQKALAYARSAYGDKKRSSGELLIKHATSVAAILSELQLDDTTVIAGLLHDTANPSVTSEKMQVLALIEKEFGKDVSSIVAKNTELNKIYYSLRRNEQKPSSTKSEHVENIRKMFLAIAKDLRVVLIELAARIDGIRKIRDLPQEKQQPYAAETLEIFVPIANRLGLGEIKRSLEDPAFAVLLPEKFTWLQEHLQEKYEGRQKNLKRFIPKLRKILQHEHILVSEISYRSKSYWSSWQKLERHQGNFEKLHDLVAIRLVVKNVSACYKALGIIHKHFTPMSGHIQDYIAKPKENGYQSLHTTVYLEPKKLSEIQIKTEAMHKEAMYGVCAHWAYKEGVRLPKEPFSITPAPLNIAKQFNIDFFENQIFAFTPKGDIIALPKGATPVDFAYAVHSDIGNHCEAAKISGHIIPLSQELQNGDVVEIITNKKRKPSYDWLKFVKTGLAKSNIRKLTSAIISPIFSVPSYVKEKILRLTKPVEKPVTTPPQSSQVFLAGQKGIAVAMAKCCNPKTGDLAKAYLSRHRAAVLHKTSCPNFQKIAKKFPEKIINATWHQS